MMDEQFRVARCLRVQGSSVERAHQFPSGQNGPWRQSVVSGPLIDDWVF